MLYVIRHGQTDWNKEKITMGRKNIPLNEVGIEQANVTKGLLNNINIDMIISSPLIRAKQTAHIINSNRGFNIIFDERIMERSLGLLEGKTYTEDNDRLWDININTSDYNVETMEKFKNRVYSFIDEIMKTYPDKDILLVTHGGVAALINCYFNNTLYDGPIGDKFLKNCSIASYNSKKQVLLKKKR